MSMSSVPHSRGTPPLQHTQLVDSLLSYAREQVALHAPAVRRNLARCGLGGGREHTPLDLVWPGAGYFSVACGGQAEVLGALNRQGVLRIGRIVGASGGACSAVLALSDRAHGEAEPCVVFEHGADRGAQAGGERTRDSSSTTCVAAQDGTATPSTLTAATDPAAAPTRSQLKESEISLEEDSTTVLGARRLLYAYLRYAEKTVGVFSQLSQVWRVDDIWAEIYGECWDAMAASGERLNPLRWRCFLAVRGPESGNLELLRGPRLGAPSNPAVRNGKTKNIVFHGFETRAQLVGAAKASGEASIYGFTRGVVVDERLAKNCVHASSIARFCDGGSACSCPPGAPTAATHPVLYFSTFFSSEEGCSKRWAVQCTPESVDKLFRVGVDETISCLLSPSLASRKCVVLGRDSSASSKGVDVGGEDRSQGGHVVHQEEQSLLGLEESLRLRAPHLVADFEGSWGLRSLSDEACFFDLSTGRKRWL